MRFDTVTLREIRKLQSIADTGTPADCAGRRRVTASLLRIREAVAEDVDALLAIEVRCFAAGPYRHHQFDRSQYRYYIRNPQAINLLGTCDGVPVASLVALAGGGTRARSGKILSIAVIRGKRRKGTALRLLTRAVSLLHQRGCERIYLEVAERATGATALFRSAGFRPVRRLPDYYGRSIHATRMLFDISLLSRT